MKALVTGGHGQLADAVAATVPPGWRIVSLSREDLDIGDEHAVREAMDRLAPDLVINAAAFTAVDLAETDPVAAWRVNHQGAGHVARAAAAVGARIVHVSTDYVFDGRAGRPYRPDDATKPLNVYGTTKLAGERAVADASPGALIVRAAWLYSAGHANFLSTMLRLMAREPEVRVVVDQIGTPTSAVSLARGLWALAEAGASGVFHYTDAGVASWYDFAVAIAEEACAAGLLRSAPRVTPIGTDERPTAAVRPAFSLLDKSKTWRRLGKPAPHWRQSLREVLSTPNH